MPPDTVYFLLSMFIFSKVKCRCLCIITKNNIEISNNKSFPSILLFNIKSVIIFLSQ